MTLSRIVSIKVLCVRDWSGLTEKRRRIRDKLRNFAFKRTKGMGWYGGSQ